MPGTCAGSTNQFVLVAAIQTWRIVKIDKRLVYDIAGAGGAIIKSVILLAEELGMSVIVEGVETQRQPDMVNELGINYVQGYFCSKPHKEMDPRFKPPVIFENFTTMHLG